MNPLSINYFNQDENHSDPAKGLRDRWPEVYFTDKYTSLVIPGYIYSVRGKPLTETDASAYAIARIVSHKFED
jgi:hypothetical protein